jgi:hypothetical protein
MFIKLYKIQLLVYLVMAVIVGGIIAIDNGVVRGAGFAIACFIFLTLFSYFSYKKQISKYGKRDI